MLEENNLNIIFENLDLDQNFQELVEEIVEDNYHYLDEPLYDEQGNFIYNKMLTEFLKTDELISKLSSAEFSLVLEQVVKYIIYKIEAKGNSHIRATEGAYEEENRSYYGGTEGAYWHLLEQYLADFNYNKTLSDFYMEYIEEKNNTK